MSFVLKSSWECIALGGERVPHGENYVPGPDYCTACKCEKGEAKFCRSALCQPPQDCNSFRVGKSCCDFTCLDGILPTIGNIGPSDSGLRMVASTITAILSIALLFFLIHRLRQRKLRTAQQQYFEEQFEAHQEACHSNACFHNSLYLNRNDHVDYFMDGRTPPYLPWKPPSYSFQPRDPPPPYSVVVASDRVLGRSQALPSLTPLMMELTSHPLSQNLYQVSQYNSAIVSESLSNTDLSHIQQNDNAELSEHPSAILSDQVYADSFSQTTRKPSRIDEFPVSPQNHLEVCGEQTIYMAPSSFSGDASASSEKINCSRSNQECAATSSKVKNITQPKIDSSIRDRSDEVSVVERADSSDNVSTTSKDHSVSSHSSRSPVCVHPINDSSTQESHV